VFDYPASLALNQKPAATRAVPLSDVATVWQDADEAARIVLTP
jgi:hypothetical protein